MNSTAADYRFVSGFNNYSATSDLCTSPSPPPPPHSSSLFTDPTATIGGVQKVDDVFEGVRTVCEVWLSLPIAVAGILGNVLSLIVLSNHKQTLTTTVVLQALAVVDSLVLVSGIVLRSLRYVGIPSYAAFHARVFPWSFPLTHAVRLLDTWLTVLLTVDRYIAVCHPLHAQRLCTVRRTRVIILALVAAVSVFCVPRYFEYESVDPRVRSTGFRATRLLTQNRGYVVGYSVLAFFVVMYLVPMTVLASLNGCILVALRRSNARRFATLGYHKGVPPPGEGGRGEGGGAYPSNRNPSSSMRTISLIAVTIVTICIVCNVTAMAAHVLYSLRTAFRPTFDHLDLHQRHLANYSNVLVTLNSAVNFVVYCAFSRKFRNVLVRMVCRPRRGRGRGGERGRCCCPCCWPCWPRASSSFERDPGSETGGRGGSSYSQATRLTSVTSARSGVMRGAERESRLLCESEETK